jgi:hypothetical protein
MSVYAGKSTTASTSIRYGQLLTIKEIWYGSYKIYPSSSGGGDSVSNSVTPTNLSFPSSGGSQTITIKTNSMWSIISIGDISLTLSKYAGTGNATVTITVGPNSSTNTLETEMGVTFSGTTYVTYLVKISQAPAT